MRQLLFLLHKYTGLIAGLLLVISGLTGSLLVFHDALDETLTPGLVSDISTPLPLAEIIARADAAVADGSPQRIDLARQPGSPHTLRFPAPEGSPGPRQISVSPYSGEILADRIWGNYPMTWIYRLHYTLLAGATGKIVVGVLGLCLLGFCLTGLYLWWPKPGKWKRALTLQRHAGRFRFHFDLHNVVGIYLLPVLLVIAFSGVSLVFSQQVSALVGILLPMEDYPAPTSRPGERPMLDADQAVAAARTVFPEARLTRLYLPKGPDGSYRLAFNQPDEPWSDFGASSVWVDAYNGEILAVWDVLNVAPGNQVMSWQFPLHNGDALGLPGRLLVLLSGVAPLLLFITGSYLWWQKRQLRRRAQRRKKQVSSRGRP